MENNKWSAETTISGWMNQEIIKVYMIKNGSIWDTHFYVPCMGKMYFNLGSARKSIAMFNKRRGC